MVDLDDIVTRNLVLALDGRRDRAAIVAYLAEAVAGASGDPNVANLPAVDELAIHLDSNLERMVKLGLLLEDGS